MNTVSMSGRKHRAVLVGLGQIGVEYGLDPKTKQHFPFATHAQVLEAHPRFDWVGACDLNEESTERARRCWPEMFVTTEVAELRKLAPEVLVMATGPRHRVEVIRKIPSLQAVILEKPIGLDLEHGLQLERVCQQRMLKTQVNLWRRAEQATRSLMNGELHGQVGDPQATHAIYGRGIRNNGIHLVDACRAVFGEPTSVQATSRPKRVNSPGVSDDFEFAFALQYGAEHTVSFLPVDFKYYRENSLDIWGTQGRLSFLQEGLSVRYSGAGDHRAISDENEINCDVSRAIENSCGRALFDLYSNLSQSLDGSTELWSPISEALRSQQLVELIIDSANRGGTRLGWEKCQGLYRRAS